MKCSFSISLIFVEFPGREKSFSRSDPTLQYTETVSLTNLKNALGFCFTLPITQASLFDHPFSWEDFSFYFFQSTIVLFSGGNFRYFRFACSGNLRS